ncbi:MAG: HD domain-containing protein [Chloroflexi bacterium]|nr:HD domain-containing protein [Chloroflexota bacterium]
MALPLLVDHVREIFARELATIRDDTLRDKAARTWARSMALGGATDLWADLPFSVTMNVRKPGLGVEHVRGVTHLALSIADALAVAHGVSPDRDVIAAGALLHDVGKLLERAAPERHALAGSLMQHEFSGVHLGMEEGLPAGVLHIIAYHFIIGERVRRTLECDIVYRADLASLEALARRELGKTAAECFPYVYLPRQP